MSKFLHYRKNALKLISSIGGKNFIMKTIFVCEITLILCFESKDIKTVLNLNIEHYIMIFLIFSSRATQATKTMWLLSVR